MYTFVSLALALAVTISAPVAAQLDAVVDALARGSAPAVSAHFDETVELVLPGVEDILPRAEAESALAEFFAANPPRAFERVHGGSSKGVAGSYVIGSLACASGTYRVYVYSDGAARGTVQELRIEEE